MTTATTTATLTRLRLNPQHRGTIADLADAHRMHRRLMSMFDTSLGDTPRATAGLLYRVERHRHDVTVLAQSTAEPRTTALPTDYATVDSTPLEPLLDLLDHHVPVRYRIDANPVAIKTTDGHKARRWLHDDEAVQWWHRRAADAGLDLVSCTLTQETLSYAARDDTRNKRRVRVPHGISRFEGTAVVSDPTALRDAVLTGIGHARAYGCGLLSLAPATER